MTENPKKLSWYLEELSVRLGDSPAGILNDALKTLYLEYVSARYRNVLRRNARFKNKYSKNDRCFIIGNGPSLAKQDLSLLANEHVFVVNWFHRHELFHKISPEYYLFITPLSPEFWGGISDKLFSWVRQLDEALAKTHGRTKLFLSLNQIDFVAKNRLFENVGVHYLLPSLGMFKYGIRKIDLTSRIPTGNTVYFSMLVAYYMGFRKIILIGCDCSWAAHGTVDAHFYGHVPYLPQITYEHALRSTLRVFKGYRIVRNFLVSKGCKVYDATEGGFLDVFPKVKYEQLFK